MFTYNVLGHVLKQKGQGATFDSTD